MYMTLRRIFEMGLVNDGTEVVVCGRGCRELGRLSLSYSGLGEYLDRELSRFTWKDSNVVYASLALVEGGE